MKKCSLNVKMFIEELGFDDTIAWIRLYDGNKTANEITKQLSRDYEGL